MTKEKNVMNNKNDVNEESRFKVYVYQNLPVELARNLTVELVRTCIYLQFFEISGVVLLI